MSAQVRRLRPVAVICAIVMLAWGILAAVALVARLTAINSVGWASLSTRQGAYDFLIVAAAALGCFAILWGLLGLFRRPPLHLGALTVLVVVALELAAIVVYHGLSHAGGRMSYHQILNFLYWKMGTGQVIHDWHFVVPPWMLPTAIVPILLWLVVVLTGAGRVSRTDLATSGVPVSRFGYDAPRATGARAGDPQVADAQAADAQSAEAQDSDAHDSDAQASDAQAPAVESAEPVAAEQAVAEQSAGQQPAEERTADEPPAAQQREAAVPPGTPAAPDASSSADDTARVWFVTVRGQDHGPYSRAQLRGFLEEGRLHSGTITHLREGESRALADVLA